MTAQEIQSTLSDAGFRAITIRSYGDFISGCRYVAMETLGSEGFKVLQFLPCSQNARWDIVRFEQDKINSRASYIESRRRSDLLNGAELRVGYEWYGKVSAKVDLSRNYFVGDSSTGFQNRGWFFTTLELFLTDEKNGMNSPFHVQYAFDRAHPANDMQRKISDLARAQAELEAREAQLRQREYFAEVEELRTLGSQLMPTNQAWAAAYYREGVVVPAPQQLPTFGGLAWDGTVPSGGARAIRNRRSTWNVGRDVGNEDAEDPPAVKPLPKVEILVSGKRKIVLEEGEN